MNSMTLPRWFGGRHRKKEKDKVKDKGISQKEMEGPSVSVGEAGDPYFMAQPSRYETFGGVHPPTLQEIAEAKKNLRKAVSIDALAEPDPKGDYIDINQVQNYQNLGFGLTVLGSSTFSPPPKRAPSDEVVSYQNINLGRPLPEQPQVDEDLYEQLSGTEISSTNDSAFKSLKNDGDVSTSSGVESIVNEGVFNENLGGNHYGTPKPSKEASATSSLLPGKQRPNETSSNQVNFPGAHPSSEGKRRRNRSNVEAMTAKNFRDENEDLANGTSPETPSGGSTSTTKSIGSGCQAADSGHPDSPDVPDPPSNPLGAPQGEQPPQPEGGPQSEDELGPLPPNWEKAYTDKGEAYFIDHSSGTSHWLDPRLSRVQKKRPEECDEDELPFGWERIDDPHYGTYFIDHVNRRTQYENPVLVAKAVNLSADAISNPVDGPPPTHYPPPAGPPLGPGGDAYLPGPPTTMGNGSGSSPPQQSGGSTFPRPSKKSHSPFFTRDPNQLRGERLRCHLVKSARGLGFTIVGGDDNVEEFLQIKSVVPNGPAWMDGQLKTGDVLVFVNDTCVLGFTHADMVSMFQSIQSGETVNLEVCRGYPLPFDPDDPNTEIVTTVAVTSPDQGDWANELERQRFTNNNADVQSMPDLSQGQNQPSNPMNRPGSADLLDYGKNDDVFDSPPKKKDDLVTIPITKGGMGFGFTIADSAFGQKVKKILDRPRCKTLQEGDILVEINGMSMRNMSHCEVVQVLKDCSRGLEANITIQKATSIPGNNSNSPIKNKYKSKKEESMKPRSGFLFRSKTPTAELYASAIQEKEKLPNRPKTPLVDTRNMRSKTPTSLSNPFQRNDATRASLGGANGYYNAMVDQMAAMGMQQQGYDYGVRAKSPGNELQDDYQAYNQIMQQQRGYPGYAAGYDNLYNNHQNYVQYPEHQEPNYGYTTAMSTAAMATGYSPGGYPAGYRSGSLPRTNNIGFNQQRKESTSFEHSEPLPGGLTRWPRPSRQAPGQQNSSEWVEMTVTLHRQDSGFGFRIVGGTEEGSQVSIGHIVPGGAADVDGRLFSGDEIVAVDNTNVLNTSHHQVVGLMGQAAHNGHVTITVRRRIYHHDGYSRPMQEPPQSYPYDVTVSRRENEGFGFVIISSASRAGSTIGRIIPGSPAERCGKLHLGDRILAVNHVDIAGMHHGDIVNLIKDSGYSVIMTVGPPIDDTSSTASTSHREEQELNLLELDDQYYAVELSRGGRGFGFSIRGGREFQSMPLFVLRIAVDGPAAADGRLRVGDQIVEINGVNTKNMTHADAIDLIKSGGSVVRLLVKRSNAGGKVPPLLDQMSGLTALSPTPNPVMSASAAMVSAGRPMSAMSQPTTSMMPPQPSNNSSSQLGNMSNNSASFQLPPGAMPLPGMTPMGQPPNGIPPHMQQQQGNGMLPQQGAGQYVQQYPNGGPLTHSSPRVQDPYFWNQY